MAEPLAETAQQLEVPPGAQLVQLPSLQTYSLSVSPQFGSEATEVKETAEPPACGSGESETETIVGTSSDSQALLQQYPP